MSAKSVYEQQLQNQLNEWNRQISDLKKKADHASDFDAKAEFNGQIEQIHALQQTADKNLKELQGAPEIAWDYLKKDIEIVWSKLGIAIKNLVSVFE